MTGPVEVTPADLYAHGGHVHAVADGVDEALAAGRSVRSAPGAYGQLCLIVPIMLGALQDVLLDGIADSAGALHGTGDLVRAAAAEYERVDEDNAAGIARTADSP